MVTKDINIQHRREKIESRHKVVQREEWLRRIVFTVKLSGTREGGEKGDREEAVEGRQLSLTRFSTPRVCCHFAKNFDSWA